MSLQLFLWDPDREDVHDIDGDSSFGFERYRTELWGTDVIRSLGAVLIPRVSSGEEVFIEHSELDALEREANTILGDIENIAAQLFDPSAPGPGAIVVRGDNGAQMHNAWGGRTPAEAIERLVRNLLRAIEQARANCCGIYIW